MKSSTNERCNQKRIERLEYSISQETQCITKAAHGTGNEITKVESRFQFFSLIRHTHFLKTAHNAQLILQKRDPSNLAATDRLHHPAEAAAASAAAAGRAEAAGWGQTVGLVHSRENHSLLASRGMR